MFSEEYCDKPHREFACHIWPGDRDRTDNGFKRVFDCINGLRLSVKRKFEPERRRDPDALPTPGQLKVIAHLWSDLAEYVPGAQYTPFQRACYREALKIPAIGPQTRRQANAAIEALKTARPERAK